MKNLHSFVEYMAKEVVVHRFPSFLLSDPVKYCNNLCHDKYYCVEGLWNEKYFYQRVDPSMFRPTIAVSSQYLLNNKQ